MTFLRATFSLYTNSFAPRLCTVTRRKCLIFKRWVSSDFGLGEPSAVSYSVLKKSNDRNIILMGCPGSGKTTIGSLLSKRLGMCHLDVDNDHLEPHWGTTVAEKLQTVGDETFIEEEGKAMLRLNVSNRIISLSGSNPLHRSSMNQLRQTGTVVYLDVPISAIMNRLHKMKVDRIVGQTSGTSIEDILYYRKQFYEYFYDIRIVIGKDDSCESIVDKVLENLVVSLRSNGYISTRAVGIGGQDEKNDPDISFSETTLEGFAQDGGLFVPVHSLPNCKQEEVERIVGLPFEDRALWVLQKWISVKEIDSDTLRRFINRAYGTGNFENEQICPVRHLDGNQYILELFHGPTASFKDLALQLMPQFFKHAVETSRTHRDKKHFILVATSGDTGGAVLDGFSKHTEDSNIGVMVLYPENGISDIQKAQMASMNGPKTRVIGVNGDFDFCQITIKRIFRDNDLCTELKRVHNCYLSAANSINWARLLPQVVHHYSAYLDLVQQGVVQLGEEVDCCIPTGNFGNILSAYYAKCLGIPFGKLICASNTNNVLSEFIRTGRYDLSVRHLHRTVSPAIDILKSSNLERYLWHVLDCRGEAVAELYASLDVNGSFEVSEQSREIIQQDFLADWCSEEQCMAAIEETYNDHNYLMDPHTAVAKVVADRFKEAKRPMLISATAHFGKFADITLSTIDKNANVNTPSKMLKYIEDLNPTPRMHQNLKRAVQSTVMSEPTCQPSYEDVTARVRAFARAF